MTSNASAPASAARRADSIPAEVSLVPTPAITRRAWPENSRVAVIRSACSRGVRVGASPVVPATTTPSQPVASKWASKASVPVRLTCPSAFIGVHMATRLVPNVDVAEELDMFIVRV
ncbi:hypothetical protein J2W54_002887 [Rhodococcus fascians]|nr:hypothetical protein [Rhodococcus sp. 3258]MDR6932493.1 hypothetical protein [Rhodococcus fascians]